MHTTLRTVDVNLDMQALGHIDAQTAFKQQFSEARDASTLLSLIAAAIPPHLDLDDPTDRQSIVDSLTPEQIDMLDSACNDTYVCVDPYAPEMTRFDCPPRAVGFIRVPGDPSPIADTEPGDYMSPHSNYVEWAHDMITTILTGIHPVAGEVPISDYRLRQLFADKRFCRVLKKTGIAPSTLIEAVALRGDPTPVEDEDSHLSPYIHRNENSRWLPPPAPEDCTPPDAARPRPGLPPIVHGWCMSDPYSTPEDDLRDDVTAVKRRLIALYPNGTPPGDPIAQALLKRLRELVGETTRQSNWQSRMASIASIFQKRGAHGR